MTLSLSHLLVHKSFQGSLKDDFRKTHGIGGFGYSLFVRDMMVMMAVVVVVVMVMGVVVILLR